MATPSTVVRFVGMLPSGHAEAAARDCIRALASVHGEVRRWDVCVQPPLGAWPEGGYAVRVQAQLRDGSVVAIRAQAPELAATVRDAFDGIDELLQQGGGEPRPPGPWLPTLAGENPGARA